MAVIRAQPASASTGGWAAEMWRGLLSALAAKGPDAARGAASNAPNAPNAPDGAASLPPYLESFETFFRRYEQDIFGYLWRMTGEEQTAYDLSQETFLRAWQRFERLRGYDVSGAYFTVSFAAVPGSSGVLWLIPGGLGSTGVPHQPYTATYPAG